MPCDLRMQRQLAAAERKRIEAERKRAIRDIENALAAGQARIVKAANGRMMIVGATLPEGMKDICVLAKLQARNSAGYREAVQKANVQGVNFVGAHNALHRGGH